MITVAALTYYMVFQLGPTARSNAASLEVITERTEREKAQDACYDQYSADITDANAKSLAALADGNSAIGGLVVLLAAQPRDPEAVDAAIQRIAIVAARSLAASTGYEKTIKARDDYVAAGEPLPCTNDPN